MEAQVDKTKGLVYDKSVVLALIETTPELTTIFKRQIKMPFSILHNMCKDGRLNDITEELLLSIFDKNISADDELIARYKSFKDTGFDIVKPTPVVEEPIVVVEKPIIVEKPKVVKVAKEVKEKVIPRRYGKEKVEKDILKQNGVATSLQRAMLSTNNLKNLYVNMSNKLIKEYLSDAVLTDEDYRKIQSVVTTVERQFKEILKKK